MQLGVAIHLMNSEPPKESLADQAKVLWWQRHRGLSFLVDGYARREIAEGGLPSFQKLPDDALISRVMAYASTMPVT